MQRVASLVLHAISENEAIKSRLSLHCLVSDEAVLRLDEAPGTQREVDALLRHVRQTIDDQLVGAFKGVLEFVRVDAYELLYLNSVDRHTHSVRLLRSLKGRSPGVEEILDIKGLAKSTTFEEAEAIHVAWEQRAGAYAAKVRQQGREPFISLEGKRK